MFGQSSATGNPPLFQSTFGAATSATPSSGGGLFGSNQPQQQQQQQPQQQQSLFSMSKLPAAQNLLQTTQTSAFSMQQPVNVGAPSLVLQELENLAAAYDVQSASCRFRHPFYNLVSPEEAPRYQRPANIPEGLWNEAVKASPDPKCMVPVFASGFGDLQKRIEHQNRQTTLHLTKLNEISRDLEAIQQKEDVETAGRLIKCQREYIKISQKVLRVMKLVQILRSRGHTSLIKEEEELRSRLEALMKRLRRPDFQGRVDELSAQTKYIQSIQVSRPSASSTVVYDVLDQDTVDDVFRVLQEMQQGLQQITDVIGADVELLEKIGKGYQERSASGTHGTSVDAQLGTSRFGAQQPVFQ